MDLNPKQHLAACFTPSASLAVVLPPRPACQQPPCFLLTQLVPACCWSSCILLAQHVASRASACPVRRRPCSCSPSASPAMHTQRVSGRVPARPGALSSTRRTCPCSRSASSDVVLLLAQRFAGCAPACPSRSCGPSCSCSTIASADVMLLLDQRFASRAPTPTRPAHRRRP
jgi:hypothetical protein